MGNLLGFKGHLNESAPFDPQEHEILYKTDQVYPDFSFTNKKTTCEYPRFWNEAGYRVNETNDGTPDGKFARLGTQCYDGDFDQVQST